MNRSDLEQIPAALALLLAVRYMPDEEFDEISDVELGNMQRWLWMARHSCTEGARNVCRVLAKRERDGSGHVEVTNDFARDGDQGRGGGSAESAELVDVGQGRQAGGSAGEAGGRD